MQDKGRGTRPGDLDSALRALSRRAAELESFARSLQADLEAAHEQLAEFIDAEERRQAQRTRPPIRRDAAAQRGHIVPLRPQDAATPDSATHVGRGAIDHRKALAAEMRVILTALLHDSLGPTASRTRAQPSLPRARTMFRASAAERKTRRLQVPPPAAPASSSDATPPLIGDRRSREVIPHPTGPRTITHAPVSATPQSLELKPAVAEPPLLELASPTVERTPVAIPPPGEEQRVPIEQPPLDGPSAAPAETAAAPAIEDATELGVAATDPDDSAVARRSAGERAVSDERHDALPDVDPRLLALADVRAEAATEFSVENVVVEPTPAMDAQEEVADEPTAAAPSDVETLWASPDDVDVASLAPSIDQPTPVADVSDPWTIDVAAETGLSTFDEPAPGTFVDTPTSLHVAASNAPLEDVIDASAIEPPAQLDPSPTVPIPDPPAVEPRGTVRELQVVLSPIGSFPELLRLQARIGSLSSVHTLRLRDFRNGTATFSVGVTEALTGREFGAVLQMFTELRLRLEGSGDNTVELRVDPEVAP